MIDVPQESVSAFIGEIEEAPIPSHHEMVVPILAAIPADQGMLGPHSSIAALQARLIQLHEPIYGTKQVSWTRLTKAEARLVEKRAAIEAAQKQRELRVAGLSPVDVTEVPAPAEPTPAERARHELTNAHSAIAMVRMVRARTRC